MRRLLICTMLLGCGACGREPAVAAQPAARIGYIDGCDHLFAGRLFTDGRCLVGDERRPLKLWIDDVGPQDAVELRFNGEPIGRRTGPGMLQGEAVGARGRIEVHVAETPVYQLLLAPRPRAYLDIFKRVVALDLAPARAALEREREQASGDTRLLLDCLIARYANWADDHTRVLELARRPDLDRLCAVDLLETEVAHALRQFEFDEARAHIRALAREALVLDATLLADYHSWELERLLGRLEPAHAGFLDVATRARALGLNDTAAMAEVMAAVTLTGLGRFDAALQLAEQSLAVDGGPDPTSHLSLQLRQNAAWVRLDLRQERRELPDPTPELRAVVDGFERAGDPERAATTRLNLLLAQAQNHDYESVAAEFPRLELEHLALTDLIYVELLQAELAEHQQRFDDAREHVERAERHASLSHEFDAQLLARLGRARLERAAGHSQAAREAYEQARRIADQLALSLSPEAGRSLFGARLRRAQADELELLLELEDGRAALCSILHARARFLRSLTAGRERLGADEARLTSLVTDYGRTRAELERKAADLWKLSRPEQEDLERELADLRAHLDELDRQALSLLDHAPLDWQCETVLRVDDPDHALLTMHPSTDGGWWFVLARGDALHWTKVTDSEPTRAAEQALASLPLTDALAGARELEITPIGEMIAVDFHMLPSLQATHVPVVYGLALGRRDHDTASGNQAAALFGRSGLRGPEQEVREVSHRLQTAGWTVSADWQPRAAEQPTLLHFAGHGHHEGIAGWESSLELPDDPLTSTELITSQRAPELVVLGACKAAGGDIQAPDGGMSMATAFLLAGAELVIAPDEDVEDTLAVDFATALYEQPPAPGQRQALIDALARVQADDGRFAAWRAWVR